MSTKTAALGYERSALLRTWLAVTMIVIVATIAIAFAITRSDRAVPTPTRPASAPTVVADYGPPTTTHGPILVNGVVCGQCR